MKFKKRYFWFIVNIFFSCVSVQKNTHINELPTWVKEGVLSDKNYYQGIGFVGKTKNQPINYNTAINNAINALAAEISISISATNTLISVEKNNQNKSDYSSVIQSRIKNDIQDCEKVANYENANGYWVHYRLSKSLYAAREFEKRKTAMFLAIEYFKNATQFRKNQDYKNAIVAYSKTIESLSNFSNENHFTEDNINLVPASYNAIAEMLKNLTLTPKNKTISVVYGNTIPISNTTTNLIAQNYPISYFPILVKYGEKIISNNTLTTNQEGIVEIGIPQILSQKKTEKLLFEINKNELLLHTGGDYNFRQWLLQIPVANATININIQKPIVYIESTEINIGTPLSTKILLPTFIDELQKKGYTITTTKNKADYFFSIQAESFFTHQRAGLYTNNLKLYIQISNSKNQIIFTQNKEVEGSNLSEAQAGISTYKTAQASIAKFVQEIENAIIKK